MSQSQLQGVTPEDYTQLEEGSQPVWYRVFEEEPGTNSWFLRLVIDQSGSCDTEITFGPMDAGTVDQLAASLCHVGYIHYAENWEGPRYESIIAHRGPNCPLERSSKL